MSWRGRDGPWDYPLAHAAPLCPSEYSRWGAKGVSVPFLFVITTLSHWIIVLCHIVVLVTFLISSADFGLTSSMGLCDMYNMFLVSSCTRLKMLFVVSRCFLLSYALLLDIPLRLPSCCDLWCVTMCQNMFVLFHMIFYVCALCSVCL